MYRNYESEIVKVKLNTDIHPPSYFVGLIKFQIDEYCRLQEKVFENEHQILVIPREAGFYKTFLGLSLIFYDLHKIRLYLNYHEKLYQKSLIPPTEPFIGIMEYFLSDLIKFASPFDNTDRLKEIMRWVEDKRALMNIADGVKDDEAEKRQNNNRPVASTIAPIEKPKFEWSKEKSLFLLPISKKLHSNGLTEHAMAFHDIFVLTKEINWKGKPVLIAYLMDKLTSPSYKCVTASIGKSPYFTIIPEYFKFCDNRKNKSRKFNFSSALYNLKKSKTPTSLKLKSSINSMLADIFQNSVSK